MDEELKTYLQQMEERTAALIAGEIGSLHTQIQQTEARLAGKLDEMSTRLDTHAGLLQSGARQITRFFDFTERSSRYWRNLTKRVDAIERRLDEGGAKAS